MAKLCIGLHIDPGTLPPRLVLSRKGADASWGGRPSLRLGEELISLPIPEGARRTELSDGKGLRYRDLPSHPRVGAWQEHLKNVAPDDLVHLDPDLRPELRSGLCCGPAIPGIFGQVGAAARHLDNQGVGPGALFLFFGWFREVLQHRGQWKRVGRDEHTIWGWLQVASVHPVRSEAEAMSLAWAKHHPHVAHWERYGELNRIYRSTESLSFAPSLPGAGAFRYKPALSLTRACDEKATRTQWCLPAFFGGAGLTYNQKVSGERCEASRLHLDSAAIGQEFVSPQGRAFRQSERAAVARWLEDLFSGM